ncbi:MAG TPA: hypothetical protein VGK00_02140 [Anaerolineales bacterium]
MQRKKFLITMIATGFLLVLGTGLWLATAQPVEAQCGSQASSCKNCHETQAQKSVNSDGTGWHQSHAFGDFCYLCHAGNQQATEKDAAHAGMVPPLQDVKAACQSCHVKDVNERAKVYADKLGIQLGGAAPAAPAAGNATAEPTKSAPAAAESSPAAAQPAPSGGSVVVENAPVIDYVEQYNESVLGKIAVNWGNIIVAIMIVLIVIGGGTLIYLNERKLRGANMTDEPAAEHGAVSMRLEDYPEDVIAILPKLKGLNPVGRKALGKLLKNPEAASDLLLSLSRLDPDLIKQMKGLNREAQALLIALAGD